MLKQFVCMYIITTVFTSTRCVLNSVMKYLLILKYPRITMLKIVAPYVSILTSCFAEYKSQITNKRGFTLAMQRIAQPGTGSNES